MAITSSIIENKLVVFNQDGETSFSYNKLRVQADEETIFNAVDAITRLQTSGPKEINRVSTYIMYKM